MGDMPPFINMNEAVKKAKEIILRFRADDQWYENELYVMAAAFLKAVDLLEEISEEAWGKSKLRINFKELGLEGRI